MNTQPPLLESIISLTTDEREETPSLDVLLQPRGLLMNLNNYAITELQQMNAYGFKYLNEANKKELIYKLKFMKSIFLRQLELDAKQSRAHRKDAFAAYLATCTKYLDSLEKNQELNLMPQQNNSVKYLGIILAQELTTTIQEFFTKPGKTVKLQDLLTAINARRLYWVWSNILLQTVLAALSQDFFNTKQAQQTLATISPIAGYVSWILYYCRFAVNLFLVLKHTIKGSWMTPEEQRLSTMDRLKIQLNQRKFIMINDLVWASINLVCFFWLHGQGALGYAGNIVTGVLLLIDLALTCWRVKEEQDNFIQQQLVLKQQIKKLTINKELFDQKSQLEMLQQNLTELQFNWKYKSFQMTRDICYGVSIITGFSIFTAAYLPTSMISTTLLAALPIIGAALLFISTIIYNIVSYKIEIAKNKATTLASEEKLNKLHKSLKQLQNNPVQNNPEKTLDNENQCKLIFLQIQEIEARTKQQKAAIEHKKLQLVFSMLIDQLIPPVIFAALVFLPLGPGLAVIGAGLALILLLKFITRYLTPKTDPQLIEFNTKVYDNYINISEQQNPQLLN